MPSPTAHRLDMPDPEILPNPFSPKRTFFGGWQKMDYRTSLANLEKMDQFEKLF